MVFSHGFGCDQNMWRFVAPAFEDQYRVVLFDHVGAGKSDLSAYDPTKYSKLEGYAEDVIALCQDIGVRGGIFVGHSVSAMIGVLAAIKQPELFIHLVLVAPSPSYINDGDYNGGFTRQEVEELLDALDSNHMGWSLQMAPVIVGNPDRPELGQELGKSFCATDPDIAKHFARVTFLSDYRKILKELSIPALILQCSKDVIAPQAVGEYMHREIGDSKLAIMQATGHCPNLSHPEETVAEIKAYLKERT